MRTICYPSIDELDVILHEYPRGNSTPPFVELMLFGKMRRQSTLSIMIDKSPAGQLFASKVIELLLEAYPALNYSAQANAQEPSA